MYIYIYLSSLIFLLKSVEAKKMIVPNKYSNTRQAAILIGDSKVPIYIDRTYLQYGVTDFEVDDGEKLQICPSDIKDQKDYVIISGKSGCGKTTAAAKYIDSYHLMFPSNKVILFSVKEEDKNIDHLSYVTRVKMNEIEKFIGKEDKKETPKKKKAKKPDEEDEADNKQDEEEEKERKRKSVDELKNSLILFDDIEQSGEYKKRLYSFKDYVVQIGRSYNINVIWCCHLHLQGNNTREDLNEATALVFFPKSANAHHYTRHLEEYVGLKSRDIRRILEKDNDWVMVQLHHPVSVVTEKEIWIVSNKEDNEDIYKNKKRKKN